MMNKLNHPFHLKIKQMFSKQVVLGFFNLFQDLYKMRTYFYGHFTEASSSTRIYFSEDSFQFSIEQA